MDFIKQDKVVILAAEEQAYGTDEEPDGTAAMLTRDFTVNPIEGQEVQRMLDRPGMGASPSLFAGEHMTCSFKVEAQASGEIGTPPAYGALLRACQMSETIIEDAVPEPIEVDYEFVSRNFSSSTIYANLDGILYRLLGFRGAVAIEYEGGGVPYFAFNGTGLWTAPADQAAPNDADYSAFVLPELAEFDTNQEISLNNVDLVLRNWQMQAPGNVNFRNLPGQKEVVVAGNRNLRSRLEVMMPSLATFNPVALKAARTLVPFMLHHGSAAGKQWQMSAPQTQVVGVSPGTHQGERTWNIDLLHTETETGDDEMLLKFL